MKASVVSAALALLVGLVQAAPAPVPSGGPATAQVTFQGAPADVAFFTLTVPTDGSTFTISNPLSISHIFVAGNARCEFFGIDGSNTVVSSFQLVDVGPPQTQVSGFCYRQY